MTITVEKIEGLETDPTDEADNLVWDTKVSNLAKDNTEEIWDETDYDLSDIPGVEWELLFYETNTEDYY